jgi:hypothetical protein
MDRRSWRGRVREDNGISLWELERFVPLVVTSRHCKFATDKTYSGAFMIMFLKVKVLLNVCNGYVD